MDNGDCVEVVYRLFADDPSVDVEAILDSVGDATPYSLALPFTLPESGSASWHFDTAGAIVEFDREQLPNACRHFVTAGKFVRMQTDSAALSIATPDLPLWKFGGMFFALSSQLDPAARQPAMLAWLANNYWEVNFLANQKGRSRSRFRLLPHSPESIDTSYVRALPYAVPPNLHAYREMGPVRHESETLFHINGDGVALQAIVRDGADLVVTLLNLRDEVNGITFASSVVTWKSASLAKLDGTPISPLLQSKTGAWIVDIGSRSLVAIRLFDAK